MKKIILMLFVIIISGNVLGQVAPGDPSNGHDTKYGTIEKVYMYGRWNINNCTEHILIILKDDNGIDKWLFAIPIGNLSIYSEKQVDRLFATVLSAKSTNSRIHISYTDGDWNRGDGTLMGIADVIGIQD